jgi:outer membrane protein OmpA-like peptidoglycan-associated protein
MKRIFKFTLVTILSSVLFCLAGCSSSGGYFKRVGYQTLNTYCTNYYRSALNKKGVLVLKNPENIKLVIPENGIFVADSANFTQNAYDTLDYVAMALKCADMEDIKVANFIYSPISSDLLIALSTERARRVTEYLWSQNINASIVYTVGKIVLNAGQKSADASYLVVTFKRKY